MTPQLDVSWPSVGSRLRLLVSGAQRGAAEQSLVSLREELEETEQPDRPEAQVDPRAFAGEAGDGRSLAGLLDGALVDTKRRVGQGQDVRAALSASEAWLDAAVQTALSDASRGATGAGIAVRPDVAGHIRVVDLPSCPRCVILAGRWYRYSEGFERHENCDCAMLPCPESDAGRYVVDVAESVRAGQVRGLSLANERAVLEGGADLASVVNVRSGMSKARRRGGTRLRPDDIYRQAGSRAEVILLLQSNGYTL